MSQQPRTESTISWEEFAAEIKRLDEKLEAEIERRRADSHIVSDLAVLQQHVKDETRRIDAMLSAEVELRRARREDDQAAILKAEAAMNVRLDAMNELRAQLNTQAATFVTSVAFAAEVDKLEALILRNRDDIRDTAARMLPRETYETTIEGWAAWRNKMDVEVASLVAEKGGQEKNRSAAHNTIGSTGVVVGVVVAIIFIAIALLNYSALNNNSNNNQTPVPAQTP